MNLLLINYFGVVIYGLLIGSFMTVCICRIPAGESIVFGRSHCPACGALIKWYHNVPIISYLALRGQCSSCHKKISLLYPAVEILNTIIYAIVFYFYGFHIQSLFICTFFSALLVVAVIDSYHRIIPDKLNLFLLVLGICYAFYGVFALSEPWYSPILGFFAASLPLLLFALLRPDSIGGGDIKLMASCGLFLGPILILLSLYMAALFALPLSLLVMFKRRESTKATIPFGPYLALGIAISCLFGNQIIHWYYSYFIF